MHFVFTDIVGSSRLWHEHGDAMAEALRRHDALASETVVAHGGQTVKHTGDGVFAVFETGDPLGFALEFQRRLRTERWDAIGGLQVRIGVAAGEARCWAGDYFGPAVNRAARLAEAAWGGQTIVTGKVLTEGTPPPDTTVADLGVFTFGDLGEPERIYQLVGPGSSCDTFPPLKSSLVRPHTLPIPATQFVGRDAEIAELVALLQEPEQRLVTLLGPGGIGKTRLAIQVASILEDDYPWGAYFVPLATISEARHLVTVTADSLRLPFQGGLPFERQLVDYLKDKRVLLVLDNLEHVMEASPLLALLLVECPEIRVVVTSRERLLLQGERVYEVKGLPYPERPDDPLFADYGAPTLVLDACRRRGALPTLGPAERALLLRICCATEGLPLALELAASWFPTLTLDDIARRLETAPLDLALRFRGVPDRHQSLAAVLDYSYRLLSPTEQTALRRLSVFQGGFTLEAADQVAEISLENLASLVDKSLVRQPAPDRFDLHEMTRHYGKRLLHEDGDETAHLLGRFVGFYSKFLAQRSADLMGPELRAARDDITVELGNIRSAWGAAVVRKDQAAISCCLEPVYVFFRVPGHDEQGHTMMADAERALLSMVVATPSDAAASATLARVRIRLGHFQALACAWPDARKTLRQGLHAARQLGLHGETALALQTLGRLWFMQGRLRRSEQAFRMSAALHRLSGDTRSLVIVLSSLGHVADAQGDYASARSFHLEAAAGAPTMISPRLRAYLGGNLGKVELEMGNIREARRVLSQSFLAATEDSDPVLISHVGNILGEVCMLDGDYEGAAILLEESRRARARLGDATLSMCTAALQARLANLQGDHEKALEYARFGVDRVRADRSGEPATECVVEEAWAELRLNGPDAATVMVRRALDEARGAHDSVSLARALVVNAMIKRERGEHDGAVEILAAINASPPDVPVGRWAAQVLEQGLPLMPPQAAAAAQGRGRHLDWRSLTG
ncbi:AAA family ATPase [Candidatus Fermentibacteria bacterium]|nr:AAA family ATPase [Candidatus Fermentibacteria bacterium]